MANLTPLLHRAHHRNALLNILGGGFSMLTVVVLPILLNRWLARAEYSIWVLGFQVVTYIPLLGFGIHQILMRTIAHGYATESEEMVKKAISSGFFLICALIGVGTLLVLLSGVLLNYFVHITASEYGSIQAIWFRVGIAASLALLALFYFGCFGSIARFEWENLYKATVALTLLGTVFFLHFQGTISATAVANAYVLAIITGLILLTVIFWLQKSIPSPKRAQVDRLMLSSFFRGMGGISVWQFSAFLVAGIDIWIIARVDFLAVPGYSLALALMTFVAGFGIAFLSPCLPRFTQELSKPNGGQFKIIFAHYQKRLLQILWLIVITLALVPNAFWQYLFQGATPVFLNIFPILLIATAIRMLTVLYAIAVVSANLQHEVIIPPLVEGLTNLVVSIILGMWLGPIGVAIGTLIGAIISFGLYSFYNIPKCQSTLSITVSTLLFPWRQQ